jgi:hypothetical protein
MSNKIQEGPRFEGTQQNALNIHTRVLITVSNHVFSGSQNISKGLIRS